MPVKKEVICLHIGQAGCQVGRQVWELFCNEHHIKPDGHSEDDLNEDDSTFESFFGLTSAGQYVPRALYLDTDPVSKEAILNSDWGRLYHPDNLMVYKCDCSNNFFEGWSMAGEYRIVEQVSNQLSKLTDNCDNFQGFMVFHAVAGGTGSGLAHRVFEEMRDVFERKPIFDSVIYPSNNISNCVVAPYNCIFSMHYARDLVDLSLMLDNQAAYKMCHRNLGIPDPSFKHINRLLAQMVSGATASLRYPSELRYTLDDMLTNLVPEKSFRYPVISLSPVRNPAKSRHE